MEISDDKVYGAERTAKVTIQLPYDLLVKWKASPDKYQEAFEEELIFKFMELLIRWKDK